MHKEKNKNMSRSNKKGPFIDSKLMKKVLAMSASGKKSPIKTWSRSCQIPPEFVGFTFQIHTGNKFAEVFISEGMVGHRLGELSSSREFTHHGGVVKKT